LEQQTAQPVNINCSSLGPYGRQGAARLQHSI
jgi:hypothetical protein